MVLAFLLSLCIIFGFSGSVLACTPTGATEQQCIYRLTWEWHGVEGTASGFVMQQMVDDNGEWYDIYLPIPVAERELIDTINADKGGRSISWRVVAYNSVGRSIPSNVASVVTPAIQNANAITVKTRPGLTVLVSRRATDTVSAVSMLINANEVLGPEGVEVAVPEGLTLVPPSRRAIDTATAVLMLVNKSQVVIINGQVQ